MPNALDLERASQAWDEGKKLYLLMLSAQGAATRLLREWDQRVIALKNELASVEAQRNEAVAKAREEADEATKALLDHQQRIAVELGIIIDFGAVSGGQTRL